MGAGALWGLALLWGSTAFVSLPAAALLPTILTAFFLPGLVMVAMIGRLAQRRFFDDATIDGAPFSGAAEIDQRVLTNTTEQLVLALAVWPGAAVLLGPQGPGAVAVLGVGFGVARVAFWLGYHLSPPLRGFGFAATFYPTIMIALWALWQVAAGLS